MNRRAIAIAITVAASAACRTTPSAPEPLRIVAATFHPEIHDAAAREARVLWQDGALATAVPGGTLWTFGDTFLGERGADGQPKCTGTWSNTLAFLPAGAKGFPPPLQYLRDAGGTAAPPLQLAADEDEKTRRLWPLAGVQIGLRTYMFFGLIDVTGPGPWGFRPVGTGLAVASAPVGTYERLPAVRWPMDPSAAVVDGDQVYLFAPRRFGGEADPSSGLLVARVATSAIEDPTRCEYFGGVDAGGQPTWVRDIAAARPACGDVFGQASVVRHRAIDGWLLATSSDFRRPDGIRLRTALAPWGPWLPAAPDDGWITVPERTGERTSLIYCTMLHPELDTEESGTVTLTFCRLLAREWAFTNPEMARLEIARPAAR